MIKEMIQRASALLLAAGMLFSCAGAEDAEELMIEETLEEEWVEEVDLSVPSLATDVEFHTPNERSARLCDHDLCFWTLPMGEMNEAAIWEVLTQPVTVLKGNQRQQIRVLAEPREDCTDYVGVVTYASQGVHVIERGEEWSLIEAYSSAQENSAVKVFALPFQGYVKTELLQEEEVDQTYGLVVDKLQQRLYVFKEGKLFSTLLCSTGFPRATTPYVETPAGEFLMISWTGDFPSGNLWCQMGIRINDGILIHEVPGIDKNDGSTGKDRWDYSRCERYLGEKASHGCIRVQRLPTPEGVNMEWLWKNLNRKPYTKVIIWDEIGRKLDYPDDDLLLYYNPKGGKLYHSQETCYNVADKYEPMTAFTYGELEEKPYSKLTRCPYCAPQLRRSEIDTLNEKNNRVVTQ